MSVRNCIHCGVTHASKQAACSSGCDLARRIPMRGKDLPASWQLGVALVWGFALFNQLLFAGGEVLSLARGEAEFASKFAIASLVAGGLVAAMSVFFFAIAKPKLLMDWQVLAVSIGLAVVGGNRLGGGLGDPIVVGFLIANLLIASWLGRGLWRRSESKNA